MSTMKGTVKAIKTKDWNGKTMYNLGVNTGGDQLEWVGFGVNNPGVREESVVSFDYKKNDKGYLVGNAKTIQVHKDEKPQASAQAQPKATGVFVDRQSSITLQTAFKVATEQAGDLLKAGIFKPATNTKAAKENAMDAYFDFVEERAARLQSHFMDPDAFLEERLSKSSSNNTHKEEDDEDFDPGSPFDDEIPFG